MRLIVLFFSWRYCSLPWSTEPYLVSKRIVIFCSKDICVDINLNNMICLFWRKSHASHYHYMYISNKLSLSRDTSPPCSFLLYDYHQYMLDSANFALLFMEFLHQISAGSFSLTCKAKPSKLLCLTLEGLAVSFS